MKPAVLPSVESLWTEPSVSDLGIAILCTVAYADVFDYPLTLSELHRYLVGLEAMHHEVLRTLNRRDSLNRQLELKGEYVTLRGRGHLVELRRKRATLAADVWPLGRRFARSIAKLPFVRAVALTGALAIGNYDTGDDLDYLIVTAARRLWLARALVIDLVVKPATRHGHAVCPNYLVSEPNLALGERNLYVAHELAQMVPITGADICRRIPESNAWMRRFLPNATGVPHPVEPTDIEPSSFRALTEFILGTFIGGQLERSERRRSIRRLTVPGPGLTSPQFTVDGWNGQLRSREMAIRRALAERLRTVSAL